VVGATGTLEAVTTVQVGSQVSGTILTLGADFNSVVKKDQVIARLDPSLFGPPGAGAGQPGVGAGQCRAGTGRGDRTRQAGPSRELAAEQPAAAQ
jgi:hypothetical protein